jgi:Protein of unknown function (DUF3592)
MTIAVANPDMTSYEIARFPGERLMAYYLGLCAIVIVALSPLLRRLYIARFWIHGRGTVIRLDGGLSQSEGVWVWTPIIEYHVAGQRFSSRVSYWQRFNAKSKYAVGDEVEILYNPRKPSRFILDSWINSIFFTIFISVLIATRLLDAR